MTARELYEQGCYLVYEIPDDDEELKSAFPTILNHIMAICLPYENQFRTLRGQDKMLAPPFLIGSDFENFEIPFCEEISRMVMPYAIQSKFLEADDDKKAESVLAYNKFTQTLNSITPAIETEMEVYDDDA